MTVLQAGKTRRGRELSGEQEARLYVFGEHYPLFYA